MKCIACKDVEMTKVRLTIGAAVVYAEKPASKMFEGNKRSPVTCNVCPKCGYMAMTADDPAKFL